MSSEKRSIAARIPQDDHELLQRRVESRGEGYVMSDAVRDAIHEGARQIHAPWKRETEIVALVSAIGAMVSGLFVLSGLATPVVWVFCGLCAVTMVSALSVRLHIAQPGGEQ
jgi:Arc/MetJ-type ribon-helix-helix transcriptional regulator